MHAQICKYFDSIARPFHWLFVVPYGSGQSLQDLLLWFAHCHSLIGGILHSITGNVVFPPEIPILNHILSRWNNANWWFQQKHLPSINNLVAHSRTVLKGLWVIDINQFPSGENEWSFYFRDLIAHCYHEFGPGIGSVWCCQLCRYNALYVKACLSVMAKYYS